MSIESVMPSNYPILCHPLLRLPSIFPSIRVFPNELSPWTKRPKYWSFSFSISPFNECSELISFRIDWFDLLAVQGTLKSLLQHHTSKASIQLLLCNIIFDNISLMSTWKYKFAQWSGNAINFNLLINWFLRMVFLQHLAVYCITLKKRKKMDLVSWFLLSLVVGFLKSVLFMCCYQFN